MPFTYASRNFSYIRCYTIYNTYVHIYVCGDVGSISSWLTSTDFEIQSVTKFVEKCWSLQRAGNYEPSGIATAAETKIKVFTALTYIHIYECVWDDFKMGLRQFCSSPVFCDSQRISMLLIFGRKKRGELRAGSRIFVYMIAVEH